VPFLFPELTAELLVALVIALAVEAYLGGIAGLSKLFPRVGVFARNRAADMAISMDRDDLSDAGRRARGWGLLAILILPTLMIAAAAQLLAAEATVVWIFILFFMVGAIGQRQTLIQLEPVLTAIEQGDIAQARRAVDPLTDQDVNGLDEGSILKAAIEGTVLAHVRTVALPVLAAVLFGLPGLFAISILMAVGQSMPRIASPAFAAPARLLYRGLTQVASPITAVFLAIAAIGGPATKPLAGFKLGLAQRGADRDGSVAVATAAGALGVKMGGPRLYADAVVQQPWINDGNPVPTLHDLKRFQTLYALTAIVSLAFLALLLLVTLARFP